MNWYTDVKLNDEWQLTQATNGDAPLVSDLEAFLQDVRLESITQEGELFYDKAYGWSLMDFLQGSDDGFKMLEIKERVKSKLAARPEIDTESISVEVIFEKDLLFIHAYFQIYGLDTVHRIAVSLNRVQVEVTMLD